MPRSRFKVAAYSLWALALGAGCARAQSVHGCPVLPIDSIWNQRVDTLPVHPNSASYVNRVGNNNAAHADFGSGLWQGLPIGIPFVAVAGSQQKSAVTFQYASESDAGPYPIPVNPPIEGGSDAHILMIDQTNCVLYELFAAVLHPDQTWSAGSGAIFDLKSNALRPFGWTSADAAGLPIFPGLARYDEVAAGEIRHALRFTANQIQRVTAWPARHVVNNILDPGYPPMGTRFRLKSTLNISTFSPQTQVLLRAMQTYGLILADIGSSWFVSGAPDPGWDNQQLSEFGRLHGTDFEAVDVSSLMVSGNGGQVTHATAAALMPSAVQPASGSGLTQSFSFVFSDPRGWLDLGIANVLFASALDGRQACYLAYNRSLNTLYLVNDAGDGLLTGLVLNGGGSTANSQCSISGSSSSVAGSGNSMTLNLTLTFASTFAGRKLIYSAARDAASNTSGWQAMGTWQVPPVPAMTASISSATPARGAGITQVFTFTYSDVPNWQNLDVVNVLINDALDGRHACYIAYSRPAGVLYLVDDVGAGLLPGIPLDGSASIENSQCRIEGIGSSVSGSGNTLTLTLSISFPMTFRGNRIVFAAARDLSQNNSGWQQVATWTVQ